MPWKEIHYFDSVDPDTDSGYASRNARSGLKLGWRYIAWRLAVRTDPVRPRSRGGSCRCRRPRRPGIAGARDSCSANPPSSGTGACSTRGAKKESVVRRDHAGVFYALGTGIADSRRNCRVRGLSTPANPLDWAWSGICKDARDAGEDPSALSDDELIARCPTPERRGRADFGANLERWLRYFPRERLFVGFHDQIVSEPVPFLDELCEFIGVTPRRNRFGATRGRESIPPARTADAAAVEHHVARRFPGEAEMMADRAGRPGHRMAGGDTGRPATDSGMDSG